MASSLPDPADCCSPCSGTATVQVPGPTGAAGSDGSNGTNGVNAYTETTGSFVMPAELANVTVDVSDSTWMTATQVVYVQNAGYMEVQSKPNSTSVILKNLEDAATSSYTDNAAPSTVIASASNVSPAGIQGPQGTAASGTAPDTATYLTVEDETTDLASSSFLDTKGTGLVRFNDSSNVVDIQGVGTADDKVVEVDDAAGLTSGELVRATANGVESVAAATGRSTLGLGTSAIVDTGVADNEVVTVDAAGGLVNGEVCRATANGIETVAASSLLTSTYGLIGELTGVDMTTIADNSVTITASRYAIDKIIVENASADVSSAQAGVATGTGGGGTTIAASGAGTLSNLTAGGKQQQLTLAAVTGTDTFTVSTLYFRVTAAVGSGTADVHVYGYIFA